MEEEPSFFDLLSRDPKVRHRGSLPGRAPPISAESRRRSHAADALPDASFSLELPAGDPSPRGPARPMLEEAGRRSRGLSVTLHPEENVTTRTGRSRTLTERVAGMWHRGVESPPRADSSPPSPSSPSSSEETRKPRSSSFTIRRKGSLARPSSIDRETSPPGEETSFSSMLGKSAPGGATLRKPSLRRKPVRAADAVATPSSPPTYSSSSRSEVTRLLKEPETSAALRDHSAEFMCEENVDAVLAVTKFRAAPSVYVRRRLAAALVAEFLADDAPRPVNVDARSRSVVLAEFSGLKDGEAVPQTLFDPVLEQLVVLIYTDILPRFGSSPAHGRMMEGRAARKSAGLATPKELEERMRLAANMRFWREDEDEDVDDADDGNDADEGGDDDGSGNGDGNNHNGRDVHHEHGSAGKEPIELFRLIQKHGSGSGMPAHSCRGAVRVRVSADEVCRILCAPGKYAEWGGLFASKSVPVKDYGTFFRVAEVALRPSHHAGMLGAMHVASTVEDECVVLVSMPHHELVFGGFLVAAEDERSCRVVCVMGLKKGGARRLVARMLRALTKIGKRKKIQDEEG